MNIQPRTRASSLSCCPMKKEAVLHGAKRKVHGVEFKAKIGLKAIYSELGLDLLCRIDEPYARRVGG